MNGLEKITQRIAAEANAECMNVAAEGNARCAAIKAEFEEKAQAAYEAALAQGRQEIEAQVQRQERNVRLDVKKELLGLKQDLVGTAFLMAREKLLNMPREEYVKFLAGLAAEAASGEEEVLLSEADAAAVGAEVVEKANAALAAAGKPAQLKLAAAARPIAGGLVLRAGDIEINCSIDALLSLKRDELAAQVAGILF